jgi:hypothetical protein
MMLYFSCIESVLPNSRPCDDVLWKEDCQGGLIQWSLKYYFKEFMYYLLDYIYVNIINKFWCRSRMLRVINLNVGIKVLNYNMINNYLSEWISTTDDLAGQMLGRKITPYSTILVKKICPPKSESTAHNQIWRWHRSVCFCTSFPSLEL